MTTPVKVGDVLPQKPGPHIDKPRIRKVMDVMDDVNPVHIDEELVKRMGLRGLVNQGPCNLSYIINMLVAWTGNPDCVKRFKVRFHNLVVPGDKTLAGGSVTAVNERDGTADCDVWLKLADGTVMLAGMATVSISGKA
jgi:acyl dehydratase